MSVVQFTGSNVRYWRSRGLMLFSGDALGVPEIFPGCPVAPPAADLGRPYYDLTPLKLGVGGEPDRPKFDFSNTGYSSIPGLTIGPNNIELREPATGGAVDETWESRGWIPFCRDDGSPLPAVREVMGADHLSLYGPWSIEVDHIVPVTSGPPINSALVGLVNSDMQAHIALGLLGSSATGAAAQLGAHIQLYDEAMVMQPPISLGFALSSTPYRLSLTCSALNGSGQARAQFALRSVGLTDPVGAAELLDRGNNNTSMLEDVRRFLQHPKTRPGIVILGNSMSGGSPASAASVYRHVRFAL